MALKEIVINTRNWIDAAQDRNYWRVLVNGALNLLPDSIRLRVDHRKTLEETVSCGYINESNR